MSVYPGNLLTATPASVSASPASSRTWQWLRGGVAIPAATTSTYRLTETDVGASVTVQQTETNVAGSAYSVSEQVGPIQTYSPSLLFAAGEQGAWYDPSDMTTMFQDNIGTTPVTGTGQTVGLLLDKSKGLVLGSELVPSQDLSSASWVSGGAFGNYAGSTATSDTITTTGISGGRRYRFACTPGQTFRMSCVAAMIGTATAALLSFSFGNSSAVLIQEGAAASTTSTTGAALSVVAIAPASSAFCEVIIRANGPSGSQARFTNISVRELAGNHAVQATAANRPIYGVHPFGGRRNLLERTEEFDNAYWSKVGTTAISANTTAAPDGNLTADTMSGASGNPATTSTNTLERVATVASSTTYTFSCYVAGAGSGTIRATLRDASTGAVVSTDQSLSGSFSRVSVTITTGAATTQINVRLGNTSGNVVIWGAQLETGSTATAYQRVTDQYNVTEAGVASVSYLFFDGADSMSTSSINFTATDKTNVFGGVRKLNDAAYNVVVDLSADPNTNLGAFNFGTSTVVGDASRRTYSFGVTRPAGVILTGAGVYAAPTTNVFTGVGDISGDRVTLRVNGAQVAQLADDQGSGNFGNFPMFIGARNGSGNFFSGNIYSLIVRGASSSSILTSATEGWVASKTGVVIA
jgi:hypothetical protein